MEKNVNSFTNKLLLYLLEQSVSVNNKSIITFGRNIFYKFYKTKHISFIKAIEKL